MEHFDLAIIGSGSGIGALSEQFAGKRVAVIEEGVFGGTCLNTGCIPSKMYVYTAAIAASIAEAGRFGVDAKLTGVRWADVRDRIFSRIDGVSADGLAARSHTPGTTVYAGHASFTGDRTLLVTGAEDVELSAEQIVVATGGHPVIPDVVAHAGVPYVTSQNVMRIDGLPSHLLVIGGGYIACEMANIFASFGCRVTMIVRGPALLTSLDSSLSNAYTQHARRRWELRCNTEVTAAASQQHGEVSLQLSDGATVTGDLLLVATGRAPNTDALGLAEAGIETGPDGRIVVDQHGRTTAEGVFALGDVSSPYQLKHVANHEARVVAHNLTHPGQLKAFNHRFVPAAVFTDPQLATVGLTEQAALEQGIDYVTATQRYADTAYGWAMQDIEGFCKLIADPGTGLLLGAHLFGAQASTLIQPLIQAMNFATPAAAVAADQYWIHPALTEVIENALLKLNLE